jgi:hypothetical protein
MGLFCALVGAVYLAVLLAFIRASRTAREGFEDSAGFHYFEEAAASTGIGEGDSDAQASTSSDRMGRQQAA